MVKLTKTYKSHCWNSKHSLTRVLVSSNNADIKGRVCILLLDNLLSTAAQIRNYYFPELHTEQQTGSQQNNGLLKWETQMFDGSDFKTNSKIYNFPLRRKKKKKNYWNFSDCLFSMCGVTPVGKKVQLHTLREWFEVVHWEAWIRHHPAWSVSRAAERVSSSWQLPLGPWNTLTTVVHGVQGIITHSCRVTPSIN